MSKSTSADEYYAFDDYRLSIGDEIKLYSGHHQVQLKLDEARVLRKLFESRPNLVPKATLRTVLGTEDEEVLRKVVFQLRKALSDPREEGRIIKTERGQGYYFVADAWPESYEVFRANIDKPRPPVVIVDTQSTRPEPIAASHAAEEKEEATNAKADGESSPADASTENAPSETDATPSPSAVENEAPASDVNEAQPPTPPPATVSTDGLNTFGKWMRGPGRLLTGVAFVCVLTVCAFSAKGYWDGWEWLNALVSGAQLILLLVALCYPIRGAHSFKQMGPTLTEDIKNSTGYTDPEEWRETASIAENVLERYKSYWLGVLITWFFLYFSLTLTGLPGLGLNCPIDGLRFCVSGMESSGQIAVRLQDQSNDLSRYLREKLPEQARQELNEYRSPQSPSVKLERAIVEVFNQTLKARDLFDVAPGHFTGLGLSKEIVEKLPDEELTSLNRTLLLRVYPESAQDESTRDYSIGLRIFTTLLNNASSLLIFLCFNILNKPKKIKSGTVEVSDAYLYVGVALVFLVALAEILMVIYSDSFQVKYEVLQGWSYVSGFFGGVAMALYFGRLQSVFLGAPGWFVVLLFIYTLIQSLFFFLEEREELAVVLIDFALLMKCLLFLYMIWLFESGRLLFYLVRVRRTYRRVIEEFGIFRRVLDKKR